MSLNRDISEMPSYIKYDSARRHAGDADVKLLENKVKKL
jgi:hypothetical protein